MALDTLVWGLVGGLAFLVPLTGYEAVSGWRASLGVTVGVAVLVTILATGASAWFRARLPANGSA